MTAPYLLTLHGQNLAAALGVATPSAARRIVLREGIPHIRLGRRLVVRAAALDAWLVAHEEQIGSRQAAPPLPTPPAWAKDLLRRRGAR